MVDLTPPRHIPTLPTAVDFAVECEWLRRVVGGSSVDAGLAALTALFDHPVRAGEDRGRDINAERLPGL